ncbi:nucleic acid/nucleotide deaminase domain-containing protein [Streptomyces lavendofoliae]|uniref:nucleic acid/nucleotide deaminase domain-containing protein n=1 Tax=Streptomyces lavendofoliae TaxID=67314 RepID=UPI0035709A7C
MWRRLSGSCVKSNRVRPIYGELEPCLGPGRYCAVRRQAAFPHAEVTHTASTHGDAAESHERRPVTHWERPAAGRVLASMMTCTCAEKRWSRE